MKMNVGDAIIEFVSSFFPVFSDPKLALSFVVDGSFDDFGYAEDGNTKVRPPFSFRIATHILITRPMNNARIYGAMVEGVKSPPCAGSFGMTLLSTHNSCWRDAISQYLNKAEAIGMKRYHAQQEHVAWTQISEHTCFSIFQRPTFLLLKEVRSYTAKEKDWIITVDKPLTLKEAAEYVNADPKNYVAFH